CSIGTPSDAAEAMSTPVTQAEVADDSGELVEGWLEHSIGMPAAEVTHHHSELRVVDSLRGEHLHLAAAANDFIHFGRRPRARAAPPGKIVRTASSTRRRPCRHETRVRLRRQAIPTGELERGVSDDENRLCPRPPKTT